MLGRSHARDKVRRVGRASAEGPVAGFCGNLRRPWEELGFGLKITRAQWKIKHRSMTGPQIGVTAGRQEWKQGDTQRDGSVVPVRNNGDLN